MCDGTIEPVCFAEYPCSERELLGEPIYSIEDALEALRRARLLHSQPQQKGEPAAWATVIFRKKDGRALQVGQSDAGWLLILLTTGESPTRISVGNAPPLPRIVFLVPEWTDLERTHVVSGERGRAALEIWLHGGDPAEAVKFRP
jgi:hypothetical protein